MSFNYKRRLLSRKTVQQVFINCTHTCNSRLVTLLRYCHDVINLVRQSQSITVVSDSGWSDRSQPFQRSDIYNVHGSDYTKLRVVMFK